ncbi:MAG: CNNM domain-containing protein, partial [Pseudomonadota bacterium]
MDPALWTILIILGLIALSAFFSGSETALTAVNRATMHQMAAKGSRGAETAVELTNDNERLIGSILLGNNLVNILAASLATQLFTQALGEAGVAWATLFMTVLVLVFAEVAPKTYAITNPERAAVRVSGPIKVVVRTLSPIVNAVRWFVRTAFSVIGVNVDPGAHFLAP